jgi:hypothetical protein
MVERARAKGLVGFLVLVIVLVLVLDILLFPVLLLKTRASRAEATGPLGIFEKPRGYDFT